MIFLFIVLHYFSFDILRQCKKMYSIFLVLSSYLWVELIHKKLCMKKLNSFPPPFKKGNVKYDIIKSPIFKNKGVYFYVYLKEHLYSKYMHVYTYINTKDIGVYL